jgi:hypothetical protein
MRRRLNDDITLIFSRLVDKIADFNRRIAAL